MTESATQVRPAETSSATREYPRKTSSRASIVVRRVHLYAGLFLLPWVMLYGVTGAMYNHRGLFPDVSIARIAPARLDDSPMVRFPTPELLAEQVVKTLQAAAPDSKIALAENHGAEFTNEIVFEVHASGVKHAVHIDPISRASKVLTHPENAENLEPMLREIRNINVAPNPYAVARKSVPQILDEARVASSDVNPRPLGWCKLNFLAEVDGEPARVTYVLRDGHVDVTRHEGKDGMSLRQFLMRLHTSHGQPPHWNSRMFWSLGVDVMAIAMVSWGFTGLFMWWQLKRLRLIGGLVIALSLGTATLMYLGMLQFYATTLL